MDILDTVFAANYWSRIFLGNTLRDYAEAALIFAAFFVALFVVQKLVIWRLRHLAKLTSSDIDDAFIRIVDSIKPPVVTIIALYVAIQSLALSPLADSVLMGFVLIAVVYQAVIAAQILIDYVIERAVRRQGENSGTRAAMHTLQKVAKWALWVVGILLVVQNFGINVTSLIAGLGIGGIALALAAQKILEDLFSSFAILFDRPFEPGDFIVAGENVGTVERIGIKSTRLRALQGEELVVPNKEITAERIQNFKKMQERRINFTFGVVYDTPHEHLEEIPALVQKAVEQTGGARFDRSHFREFGDSALVFDNVYYVESGDYNEYMNINQRIMLAIAKTFGEKGIAFAYPTQTIHLQK
jgi:small-conductance mechanosensitive channel